MKKDLTGKKFGHLTVIRRHGSYNKNSTWICLCDCGNYTEPIIYEYLTRRSKRCCGCQIIPSKKKIRHGLTDSKTYESWKHMKQRVTNHKDRAFPRYGGRGIKIAERWLSFVNFLNDMGERPENTSLDRINNNGNYEPGNCRWATPKEQANNKRPRRKKEYCA